MKKRLLALSMILAMSLAAVACGQDDDAQMMSNPASITEEADDVEDTVDTTEAEDVTGAADAESDVTDDAAATDEVTDESEDITDNAGVTEIWCGYLMASNKDQSGEPDEYGMIQAIIYDGGFDGDTFTVYGTLNFKNDPDQDPIGMVPGDKNSFKVDDNTQYQLVGGEGGPEIITKDEFAQHFADCLDTGLYFEVQLVDGVATVVLISS